MPEGYNYKSTTDAFITASHIMAKGYGLLLKKTTYPYIFGV